MISNEVMTAIDDVLACEEPIEAMAMYLDQYSLLKGCRFILFSNELGTDIPFFIKYQKIDNFHIHSITTATKMLVIDADTCNEMLRTGSTKYNIDACIALDTQTVSYLRDIFTENPTQINKVSKYYIDYLIKNNINFDYSLYMLENAQKVNTTEEKVVIYENLLACERFKALDTNQYLKDGAISYLKSNDELKLLTDDAFRAMNNESKAPQIETLWKRHHAIKALLLKTAIIELQYPKKGIKYKINMLLEFVNKEIGCILEREIAICYLFLSHDKRIEKFFKKIKPNCVDIVKHISGMAWDLFHLRHLEFIMATLKPLNARYELYSIITFDYGLQEVLEVYPIKKCAIYDGIFLPVFEIPIYELIQEIEDLKKFIYDTKALRMATFKNANYISLNSDLEIELNKLIRI